MHLYFGTVPADKKHCYGWLTQKLLDMHALICYQRKVDDWLRIDRIYGALQRRLQLLE
jgi:hypothetical protein